MHVVYSVRTFTTKERARPVFLLVEEGLVWPGGAPVCGAGLEYVLRAGGSSETLAA